MNRFLKDYEWPIVLGIESKFVSSKKRPESDKDKNKMSLYAPHSTKSTFPCQKFRVLTIQSRSFEFIFLLRATLHSS